MKLVTLVSIWLVIGCIPDVGDECRKILEGERAKIIEDVGRECAARINQSVVLFLDSTLASYDCARVDGGLWDCSGTLLCR